MKSANPLCLALTVSGLLGLMVGCGRKAETPASVPPTDPSATTPAQAATPATAPPIIPTETATELRSAIAAAQAATRTQNYSNVVQRFDALRSSGRLTGDQLTQIQDTEARMMRELAAKATAGDKNALRQFQEISNRPRHQVQN